MWGYLQIIHLIFRFSMINHPFLGYPHSNVPRSICQGTSSAALISSALLRRSVRRSASLGWFHMDENWTWQLQRELCRGIKGYNVDVDVCIYIYEMVSIILYIYIYLCIYNVYIIYICIYNVYIYILYYIYMYTYCIVGLLKLQWNMTRKLCAFNGGFSSIVYECRHINVGISYDMVVVISTHNGATMGQVWGAKPLDIVHVNCQTPCDES